jgi:hypothetical protein
MLKQGFACVLVACDVSSLRSNSEGTEAGSACRTSQRTAAHRFARRADPENDGDRCLSATTRSVADHRGRTA